MIERVLVAPLNYSHRQRGQIEAFRKIFGKPNTFEFDFMDLWRRNVDPNEPLIEAAIEHEPDWIWLQVQGSNIIQPWALHEIRKRVPHCFISHWMGDCRPTIAPDLAEICRMTHATLISSVGQMQLYRDTGAPRVEYVQIGLDPEDIGDGPLWEPPFRVPDVVFCGGHYGHVREFAEGTGDRLSAIRRLAAKGFDVGVVGQGWPSDIPVVGTCHVKQQHYIYKRAKIALSINHFNNIDRYYSDRLLIAMASGTAVLVRRFPGFEQEFASVACPPWSDNDELTRLAHELLSDDAFRKRIGTRGRERVLKDHTWEARIRALVPKIEAWRKEDCL